MCLSRFYYNPTAWIVAELAFVKNRKIVFCVTILETNKQSNLFCSLKMKNTYQEITLPPTISPSSTLLLQHTHYRKLLHQGKTGCNCYFCNDLLQDPMTVEAHKSFPLLMQKLHWKLQQLPRPLNHPAPQPSPLSPQIRTQAKQLCELRHLYYTNAST